MQTLTFGENYSGIGPNDFNKRQLLEIIRMRQKAGRKTRSKVSMDSNRTTLVNEAKRVRGSYTWREFYFNDKVQNYATY